MRPFLSAAWRRLVLFNYRIPPDRLLPYLPAHTELDFWNDTCYVSLVGFMFQNTRVKGIQVPFHVHFEEVNLRFYVRRGERRGVAFVREFVPKPAITWVARNLYAEPYRTLPMSHRAEPKQLFYKWGEHSVTAHVGGEPQELAVGSAVYLSKLSGEVVSDVSSYVAGDCIVRIGRYARSHVVFDPAYVIRI